MGREVLIAYPPQRIVSLVPSQTELLFDLGLADQIVGLTKFCVHPAGAVKSKTKVGGTKKVDIELIRSLKPDLIIGNKEENERLQIETLMREFPVWMSDITTLKESLDMIIAIGEMTGCPEKGNAIAKRIENEFLSLSLLNRDQRLRVTYFIWKNPYMVAGADTFIDDLLSRAGWENAVKHSRYPELSRDAIADAKPNLIFLSSEPYPFREKHIAEFSEICPAAKVVVVDGEMFSWYGSRLQLAAAYLKTLSANRG